MRINLADMPERATAARVSRLLLYPDDKESARRIVDSIVELFRSIKTVKSRRKPQTHRIVHELRRHQTRRMCRGYTSAQA